MIYSTNKTKFLTEEYEKELKKDCFLPVLDMIETQTTENISVFQSHFSYPNHGNPKLIEDFASAYKIDCNPETNLNTVLKNTFEDLESEAQKFEESGSTACVSIITKDQDNNIGFTIANLGDSGAVLLIEKDDSTLLKIKLTEDHDPNLPRIRKEIERKGGEVTSHSGKHRVNGRLAMGGALGDKGYKLIKLPDIFTFKPGTQEYQVLEGICKEEGVNLQESIKNNQVRLVSFTDGIGPIGSYYWGTEKDDKGEDISFMVIVEKDVIYDYEATLIVNDSNELTLALQKQQKRENTQYYTHQYYDYFENNREFIFGRSEAINTRKAKVRNDDVTFVSYNPGAVLKDDKGIVIGVFDGHSDQQVAKMANEQLVSTLEKHIQPVRTKFNADSTESCSVMTKFPQG
jgi:serine/threonine protein phosphatase PrpC